MSTYSPLSPPTLETATAVVAAPTPIWREALARLVSDAGVPDVHVTAEVERAAELVERHDAALAVIHTSDDPPVALQAVRALSERRPGTRTILLADRDDLDLVEQAFDAGVFAYLLRTADPGDLAATVRQAFTHSIFLSDGRALADVPSPPRQPEDDAPRLTRRELQILLLVATGRSNAEVARTLWVTEPTVKFHLSNVYRKLGVANRTEAARWAGRQGLLRAADG